MFAVVRISLFSGQVHFSKYCLIIPNFLPTGQPGWGIAWYIDGLLVPQLTLTRGQNYTFRLFGGDDDNIANRATYHPFYITDSKSGGRLLNSPAQRMVHMHASNQTSHVCYLVYRMKQCMQASMVMINLQEVSSKSTNSFLL